jgi:hypothetical protein
MGHKAVETPCQRRSRYELMSAQNPEELLQLITAAVTPVVMVSVGAVLILGINSKHQSIADRIRNLTGEFRHPDTTASRKDAISRQMVLFRQRVSYASTAQSLLYLAIALFLATVILIILSRTGLSWTPAAFGLFLAGVLLMLTAVILEFRELRLASRTLAMEMEESVSTAAAREPEGRG